MWPENHKSKGWACQWLKRYKEKGLEGLMDRPKGGRHPQVSRQVEYRIKTILKESNHGWTTKKQVEEMIIQESGVRYHHNYIYRICKWGFKQKVPRKTCKHCIHRRREEWFQKKASQILLGTRYQKKGFTLVSLDESFIFYDSGKKGLDWWEEKTSSK